MSSKKTLTYIDLFSGIGGFRKALELLAKDLKIETTCVGFSEIDKHALKTYKANFNTARETEMGDISVFTQQAQNIKKLPAFDILFGGFPCQPFSMMGNKRGLEDERGSLFFAVTKILEHKQPRYVLLENVRNLYTHNNGLTYKKLKNELQKIGYNVHEDIFNTSNFGLPQHRRRLYIFATLKPTDSQTINFKAEPVHRHFKALKKRSFKSYKNVLDGLLTTSTVDEKFYLSERIKPTILANGSKNFKSNSEINQLIARPLTATMVKLHRACQDNYYSQEFLDSPSPLKYLEKPIPKTEEARHRIRKLTPLEALKLQGFCHEFYSRAQESGVSNHQLYRQAGNAVSVNAVYSIMDYLIHEKAIEI